MLSFLSHEEDIKQISSGSTNHNNFLDDFGKRIYGIINNSFNA